MMFFDSERNEPVFHGVGYQTKTEFSSENEKRIRILIRRQVLKNLADQQCSVKRVAQLVACAC